MFSRQESESVSLPDSRSPSVNSRPLPPLPPQVSISSARNVPVLEKQGSVKPAKSDLEDKELEEIENIISQLECAKDVLEAEAELKPFRIFGIEAQGSLVVTLLTSMVSFYGVVFSLYSNNLRNQSNALTNL